MSYYNTTKEEPKQVEIFKESNEKQEEVVLEIVKEIQKPFGASDIFNRFPVASTPLTSIRRAINTLYKNNKLRDTGKKKDGLYGRPEKLWELVTGEHITTI
jgi:hypothetical protein